MTYVLCFTRPIDLIIFQYEKPKRKFKDRSLMTQLFDAHGRLQRWSPGAINGMCGGGGVVAGNGDGDGDGSDQRTRSEPLPPRARMDNVCFCLDSPPP